MCAAALSSVRVCVGVFYCDFFIFCNNTCYVCLFVFFFFVFFLRNGFFTEEKTNDCSFSKMLQKSSFLRSGCSLRSTTATTRTHSEEDKRRRKMDPLATTERFEREFREALSFNSSLSSSSNKVVKTRIQFALEAVLSATTPRDVYDTKDDEHYPFDSDEKELEKIETLAEFFYQCASVDLNPHAFDVRLENVTNSSSKMSSISEETKASLRSAYVRNKTELTRACRTLAEMEDEKTTEQLEKIEWRMSAETSSRMRQNRGRHREGRDGREEEESEGVGGDRLRYVVKVTLRSVGEKKKNAAAAKRRVEVFECSYETLKKLSEDVEKCREKSEDARARRIRRFVKRPT